jgi:hypothetical protein
VREFISHDAYLDVSRCLCHGMRWLLLAPQFPAPCPNPIAWVKIGASFLNKGGSESVLLDALPVIERCVSN